MINFVYDGNISLLRIASAKTEEIMNSEKFLSRLNSIPNFAMSYKNKHLPVTGSDIVQMLKVTHYAFRILTYKGWFWSRVNAYTTGNNPKDIYVNTRHLEREVSSICATIAHESVHLLDFASPWIFGHSGNSPKGKQETAPWVVGTLVEQILTKG
jgi:hypothetical protein